MKGRWATALVNGFALLTASAVAGVLWDHLGVSFRFYAGAAFCGIAIPGLLGPVLWTVESRKINQR